MMIRPLSLCALAFSLAVLSLAGCGDKSTAGSVVNGKLILPPDMKLIKTDSVEVRLVPADPGAKKMGRGSNNSEGQDTFAIKDVAPGKYKVVVSITPYPGEKENEKRSPFFEERNKKYDEYQTKLMVELGDAKEQTIEVDLVNDKVTKK